MHISSAHFMKGLTGDDSILHDGIPQIAFIGRSNVGKSSLINALVNVKNLAKSSSTPGRTQQINIFLIKVKNANTHAITKVITNTGAEDRSFYLADLPGYGYAKGSFEVRNNILGLINWYLKNSGVSDNAIVLIIDAKVGPTEDDMLMLKVLESLNKKVIVVANKIDKIKPSEKDKTLKALAISLASSVDTSSSRTMRTTSFIPFSAEKKIGIEELRAELFN